MVSALIRSSSESSEPQGENWTAGCFTSLLPLPKPPSIPLALPAEAEEAGLASVIIDCIRLAWTALM